MVNLSERFKISMKTSGVSKKDLHTAMKVSFQALAKVLSGETKEIGAEKNQRAAELMNVSARWLATGSGRMREHEDAQTGLVFDLYPIPHSAGPGADSTGFVCDEIRTIQVSEEWALQHLGHIDTKRIKLVPVCGISMSPTIPDGSLLFVDTEKNHFAGDGIYCIEMDGALYVKRVVADVVNQSYNIISDNNPEKPQVVDKKKLDRLNFSAKVVSWMSVCKPG